MNPSTTFTTRQKAIFGIGGLLVIITGSLLLFFYNHTSTEPVSDFDTKIKESLALLSRGDYEDAAQSTVVAKNLAVSGDQRSSADFLHARALLGRKHENDMTQAVTLFKIIAQNENTEPQRRAGAFVSLASIYFQDPQRKIVKDLVFSSEPFSSHLTKTNGDIDKATIDLLEQANVIFPTAFAYNDIANIYRLRIHKEGIQPGNAEQIVMAQGIVAALAASDALANKQETVTDGALVASQVSKALSLGTASYIVPDLVTNDTVNQAYEKSLELMKGIPSNDVNVAIFSLTYTTSLQARQPDAMSDRINSLLSEISALGMKDTAVRAAFINAQTSTFTARQMPALMAKNADFAQFVAYTQNATLQ